MNINNYTERNSQKLVNIVYDRSIYIMQVPSANVTAPVNTIPRRKEIKRKVQHMTQVIQAFAFNQSSHTLIRN